MLLTNHFTSSFASDKYLKNDLHQNIRFLANGNLESRQSEFTRRKDEALSSDEQTVDSDVDGPLQRQEISQEDHPLSLGKASVWHEYFQVHVFSILRLLLNAFCHN